MLNKWIEFGRVSQTLVTLRNIRRWINEERGRVPVIDRVQFPDTGYNRRLSRRG